MNNDWIDKWFEVKDKLDSLAYAVHDFCSAHSCDCDDCPLSKGTCEVYSANRPALEFIAKTVEEHQNQTGVTGVTG